MAEKKYHLRRSEMVIASQSEIDEVIQSKPFMTVAMCKDNEPYLVTVNHSYDNEARSLYFHCAQEGKKNDFLSANSNVWGQVVDDRGYVEGKCEYNYRSVQFVGEASKVDTVEEKKHAFELMMEKLDDDPEKLKAELFVKNSLEKVVVYRIDISAFSGKKSMK